MLGRPREGAAEAALGHALATMGGLFASAGYAPITLPHLYLGETMLDLYGEDLRARAFLFPDAERGNELCLRPDFTVPVALAHAAAGWERPGAYAYQGPVFRCQPVGQDRPVEYLQAGVERFGDPDPIAADVDVFVLVRDGLAALGVPDVLTTIGDLAVPFALLDALAMPERRRAALKRHFWRPHRFQELVRRAVARPDASDARSRLLAMAQERDGARAVAALMIEAGETVGRRAPDAVVARARRLVEEAAEPAMPGAEADLIDALFAIEGTAPEALRAMRALTAQAGRAIGPQLVPAIDRFEARLAALDARGVGLDALTFSTIFGRNLEYYDGFVFEMRARDGYPPLAGGGRYDALTRRLGAARPVPAVGAMIRPEAVLGPGVP